MGKEDHKDQKVLLENGVDHQDKKATKVKMEDLVMLVCQGEVDHKVPEDFQDKKGKKEKKDKKGWKDKEVYLEHPEVDYQDKLCQKKTKWIKDLMEHNLKNKQVLFMVKIMGTLTMNPWWKHHPVCQ